MALLPFSWTNLLHKLALLDTVGSSAHGLTPVGVLLRAVHGHCGRGAVTGS
jgi:hypothetical protein